MSVTPTGILSIPFSNLQTLLADCATFQAWVDADNATEAKESIHFLAVDADEATRPFALISPDAEWTLTAISSGPDFSDHGALILTLEADISEVNVGNPADEYFEFANAVGGIIDEMSQKARSGAYMMVSSFSFEEAPYRSRKERKNSDGDYCGVSFKVTY